MKIVKLTAENIKKLKAVEITPDGNVVQVTGPNGSGKSSVLDAIYYALAGTADLPSQPVRQGEEKAVIRLDLGEVTVIRRFTAAGGTSLVVEAANGARFPSPQTMLDQLLGRLTFDPLAFARSGPRQQLEALRQVVKLDRDLDVLDAETRRYFDARTGTHREIRGLEARVAALPPVPNGTPDEPLDIAVLVAELDAAGRANANLVSARRDHEDKETAFKSHQRSAEDQRRRAVSVWTEAERRADELRRRAQQLLDEANDKRVSFLEQAENFEGRARTLEAELAEAPPLPSPVDTGEIQERIKQAQVINNHVRLKRLRQELQDELTQQQEKAAQETAAIEANVKLRTDTIAAAAIPLPGLSFGQGEVLLNGLPFAQAGDAEQLRVSVAIAMAMNPRLRVLRVKDGSLLDETGLRLLAEMAREHDYQIWIERVDTSGRVGVVMEDGTIRAG